MMSTDLIKSDMTDDMKKVFNLFCETPETVAKNVVPKILTNRKRNIIYLNPFKIIELLCKSPFRGKLFV